MTPIPPPHRLAGSFSLSTITGSTRPMLALSLVPQHVASHLFTGVGA